LRKQKQKIKLGQLLNSLSFALDIAENRYFNHSRRTAYIAYSIAKEMKLKKEDVINIYFASLIHDIGMAGYMSKYTVMDIHTNPALRKEHCSYGYKLLEDLPIDYRIKESILYHHEQWNGLGPFGLKADEIPLASQIIHIADYFEVYYLRLAESKGEIEEFSNVDSIEKWLHACRDTFFKGEICDVLLSLVEKEKFWFDLTFRDIGQILELIEPHKNIYIDLEDLYKISEAFSKLIDYKSKFTYEHSKGISNITHGFATFLGYDPLMVDKLSIAANLHDIGKLVVPVSILEKPDKLSESEFQVIKSHPYYTKLILKQIEGIEDIAEWAGNHHERLNGKGYPEKLTEAQITREDQIIAIVDIYQALTEDRPYRKGYDCSTAIGIMKDMVDRGEISREMLNDFKHYISYSEVLL
jgi:HD-GYP domain-containing protein (c-di-GMP phosphodiesterase class II)